MKKTLLLLTFCIFVTSCSHKSLTETEKLTSLAKVWGFLKYYHPQVANGKFNWDEELFKILPKVKNATNKEQLSKIYIDWIETLGEIQKCEKCNLNSNLGNFSANFDLNWLDDNNLFTEKLSKKLRYIQANRHQGKKQYVSLASAVGNIEITNEESYPYDWENENLRLLTLFRYWNIIEYFYPYKYQTDTKWSAVLNQIVLKFQNPKSEMDFNLAMLELIVSVEDSHARLVTKSTNSFFGLKGIPAKFEIIEEKAIVTELFNDSLALLNDLKIGDIINKVNGKSIQEVYNENERYISGSNEARKKINAYAAIFNGSTDSVNIEVLRNNKIVKKSVGRYPFTDFKYNWEKSNEKFKTLKDNIGYINMGEIEIEDVPKIMDSLVNTKALVMDIRNYPNSTLYLVSSYISSKTNDFYSVTRPVLDYPGKFIWQIGNQCGNNKELEYKGKVILLVNGNTESQAEFTTMCLQTGDNVVTIGNQTSGADGNVSRIVMVGGFKTAISGIGIFYPDGTVTQRKGVKIDVEVNPTLQGILDGKDEVLDKAIEFANE
ncbi:S41 family peptidase [Psychroserpens burtonensis]|uniref:S41 family peptidase n=1 Tax=Psychroserpens burtonensis TaxID=49278 RepID=UPI00048D7CE1|nr:S41 family peptidase [Psychroserpens burtonensis]